MTVSSAGPAAVGSAKTAMLSRLRRAILLPWWAAQAFTAAKSFERNPLIGSPLLNRWGLHAARVALAHRLAWARRRRLARMISAADRASFDRDGFVLRRNFLPDREFAALLAELEAYRGPSREIAEGDTLVRKIALGPRTLARLPALGALLRSPDWRGLVRYAGGRNAEPVVWVQSILRHACAGPPDPQTRLHADTFHPTVKAWLFLTDVGAEAGPFTYVPGSHRLSAPRLAWERQMSLAARRSTRPRHKARLVSHRCGRTGRAGARPAAGVCGSGQHARRCRYLRLSRPRAEPAALVARRDLGLWPAQPVFAVGIHDAVDHRDTRPAQPARLEIGRSHRTGRGQKAPLAGKDWRFAVRSAGGRAGCTRTGCRGDALA